MKKSIYSLFVAALLCAGFASCDDDDDDVKLQDIAVDFTSSELGLGDGEESVEATVSLSRPHTTNLDVTIQVETEGVTYNEHFLTTPAVQDNQIILTVPAGTTSASFKISKNNDVFFEGTENIKFTIQSLSVKEGLTIGEKKELKLTFKAIVSQGENMTLQGRVEGRDDAAYANQVYIDLSKNRQVSIDRKNWALAFYCGEEFRVFLNPAMRMAAAATSKTDINAVTSKDLEGLPPLAADMMQGIFVSLDNVDDISGDKTKTAIAEIASEEAENKVHIVSIENLKEKNKFDYYKVKITRNGAGYRVAYGLVDGTEINTIEVAKDPEYNRVGVSFAEKKIVTAEPKLDSWDIVWGYGTGLTSMGGQSFVYFMQDLVLLNNLGGAEVAEVVDEAAQDLYAQYTLEKAKALSFKKERNTIGNNWRATARTGGYTGPLGVKPDRFYVIKDRSGNYYKLRFLKMGVDDDGIRGNVQLEYALLK